MMTIMNESGPARKKQADELAELKLFVDPNMFKAFQRCVWVLVNETGRGKVDIMEEAVRDFLVKHGC